MTFLSPRSPFNTPPWELGIGLDPTSATRVGKLAAAIRSSMAGGYYPAIAADSYSVPVYEAPAGQPLVPVVLDNAAPAVAKLRAAFAAGVPVPPGAQPAAGTDAHMVIRQGDRMWEFWRASLQADGWHVGWGGAMQAVSECDGHYSNESWPGLGATEGFDWGASACSIPVLAGMARLDELKAGRIPHALAAAIPQPAAGMWAWPAQRTDGHNTDPDAIPLGAHLRLDPTVDVSGLPTVTRILAKAAQEYGVIVRDTTGAPFSFYAEPGTPALYEGLAPWRMLKDFPWERLQLLRMTTCTTRPCRPAQGQLMTTVGDLIRPLFPGVTLKDTDTVSVMHAVTVGSPGVRDAIAAIPGLKDGTYTDTDVLIAMEQTAVLSAQSSVYIFEDTFDAATTMTTTGTVTVSAGRLHLAVTSSTSATATCPDKRPAAGHTWTVYDIADLANAPAGIRIRSTVDTSKYAQIRRNGTNLMMWLAAATTTVPFSAIAHKNLRLRPDGSSLFYEASPDGQDWTAPPLRVEPLPAWMTTDQCEFAVVVGASSGPEATVDRVTLA